MNTEEMERKSAVFFNDLFLLVVYMLLFTAEASHMPISVPNFLFI